MPADLIFEVGTEEMPASYVPPAVEELKRALRTSLAEARLSFGSIRTFATPRRLAAIVAGIADVQEERTRTVTGPPAKVAFAEDGTPTKAAMGFARSQGVEVSDLEVVDGYVRVTVLDEGRPAAEVLPPCLAAVLASLTFPKTMRWGPDVRFARPIRWIVALLGDAVLDLTYAGVDAGRCTYGHRFWSPGPHEIPSVEGYEELLERNYVVPDQAKREDAIVAGIRRAARECGGKVVEDEELLDEVTFLVEYPTAFAGRFDERFLKLPRDVVVAAMKGHQRYFAVEDEEGTLLPFFLCVANTPPDYVDLIRKGNERVLESRLADAEFYWTEDTRTPLAEKVEELKNVVWLEGLGSLYDKTERIEKLCRAIAQWISYEDVGSVVRAARLSKADLVTEMVKDGKEFTELEGTMGREYAAASGEPPAVATAIYEHYLPRFAGDALPATVPGIILSVADRVDSIVGCFSAGLVPTGSQDPYALRRRAIGLVRILDEKKLPLSLRRLVEEAAVPYGADGGSTEELVARVLDFLRQRARVLYIDAGYAYDLVDAVLEASLDDIAGVRPRLAALSHFRENEDFEGLVIGARRVMNILKGTTDYSYDPAALVEPASRALEEARARAAETVDVALGSGDLDRAVRALLDLRRPIDAFFDAVLVMVEDDGLRRARLGLLAEVRKLFLRVADFAKVVLEGEVEGETE